MKVAVLGYGVEGRSAAKYWAASGHEITVCDSRAGLEIGDRYDKRLGRDYLQDLDDFDLIVRTQSLHPNLIKTTKPVTSVTREFLEKCPSPVIGVTGTKGKGTTSSLIAAILKECGKTVHLGGNIGVSGLDFIDQIMPSDYAVMELSSFQLMDITVSPQIAVMLMISDDHLDWHHDRVEYSAAKARIFSYQHPDDVAIYNCSNIESMRMGQASEARHVPYNSETGAWVDGHQIKFQDTVICETGEVGLVGHHNVDNICAAIAATWGVTDGNVAGIKKAIAAFTGLEHRLEFVREVRGVKYYDDSFSTNPETAIAAIRSFDAPKLLILGGSEKHADYSHLVGEIIHSNTKYIYGIGDTAGRILDAVEERKDENCIRCEFSEGKPSMSEVVRAISEQADPGDVVLLSPASASFGLFKNYKDRGEQFKKAVADL